MSSTFVPNADQQKAADEVLAFLFSKEKEHRISGPGGVGKTALMKYIIDVIIPRYFETCEMMGLPPEFTQTALTATTNKAAEALMQATGLPCSTIHSFLSLKVVSDYSTGKQKIQRTKSWEMKQRTIIFIDEASMLDRDTKRELHDSTMQCKIIYIGDHCQLKPVNEAESPVYMMGAPTSYLTIPMRTDVPELKALNDQLRDTVETGIFKPIQIVPGIIDYMDDEAMEAELAATFSQQNTTDRILAFTNSQVRAFNDHIRTLRQLPDDITAGERLVNNSALVLPSGQIHVECEVEILKVHGYDTHTFVNDKDAVSISGQRCDLRTWKDDYTNVFVPTNRQHVEDLIKYYAKQKDWEKHFFLKERMPDLRQRDAATLHKAQGSSYTTTYIDAANLSTCRVPDTVARLLYVGASRARKRVVFYGELASKYGGFIH